MNSNFQLTVPVLLIAFNRPETTKIVFEKVRHARPLKFYVAVDGPRKNNKTDEELVDEVRRIVQEVDWPCDVKYKFNEDNLGAEITVSFAISWVLEKEKYVIILEDDIVAPLGFFRFVQEMLEKYKNEKNIWAVSGVNFLPIKSKDNSDYFFAKYGHTWGWGTWKRVWCDFDLNMEVQKIHLKTNFLKTITNSEKELRYFKKKFKKIKKKGVGNSSWDNIASYMHRSKGLLYIVPKVNLVSNIGIQGLHAKGKSKYHYRRFDENFKVKNHPETIACNIEYDKYYFKNYILADAKPFNKRFLSKVKSRFNT